MRQKIQINNIGLKVYYTYDKALTKGFTLFRKYFFYQYTSYLTFFPTSPIVFVKEKLPLILKP